jgi:hypothetical protein
MPTVATVLDRPTLVIDLVKHVSTPAGAAFYELPIGAPIVLQDVYVKHGYKHHPVETLQGLHSTEIAPHYAQVVKEEGHSTPYSKQVASVMGKKQYTEKTSPLPPAKLPAPETEKYPVLGDYGASGSMEKTTPGAHKKYVVQNHEGKTVGFADTIGEAKAHINTAHQAQSDLENATGVSGPAATEEAYQEALTEIPPEALEDFEAMGEPTDEELASLESDAAEAEKLNPTGIQALLQAIHGPTEEEQAAAEEAAQAAQAPAAPVKQTGSWTSQVKAWKADPFALGVPEGHTEVMSGNWHVGYSVSVVSPGQLTPNYDLYGLNGEQVGKDVAPWINSASVLRNHAMELKLQFEGKLNPKVVVDITPEEMQKVGDIATTPADITKLTSTKELFGHVGGQGGSSMKAKDKVMTNIAKRMLETGYGEAPLSQLEQDYKNLTNGVSYMVQNIPEAFRKDGKFGWEPVHATSPKAVVSHPMFGGDERLYKKALLEYMTSHTVHTWAVTSNDQNKLSLAIQDLVEEMFQVAEAFPWYHSDEPYTLANRGFLTAFIHAMYEDTQAHLKASGIEKVTLVRGMSIGDFKPGGVPDWLLDEMGATPQVGGEALVTLRPLSSFSTLKSIANRFGSFHITMEIPVEKILGMAGTGFGALNETEVVVIGGPNTVAQRTQ